MRSGGGIPPGPLSERISGGVHLPSHYGCEQKSQVFCFANAIAKLLSSLWKLLVNGSLRHNSLVIANAMSWCDQVDSQSTTFIWGGGGLHEIQFVVRDRRVGACKISPLH